MHTAGQSWVFDDLSPREFAKELLLSHAHIGLQLKAGHMPLTSLGPRGNAEQLPMLQCRCHDGCEPAARRRPCSGRAGASSRRAPTRSHAQHKHATSTPLCEAGQAWILSDRSKAGLNAPVPEQELDQLLGAEAIQAARAAHVASHASVEAITAVRPVVRDQSLRDKLAAVCRAVSMPCTHVGLQRANRAGGPQLVSVTDATEASANPDQSGGASATITATDVVFRIIFVATQAARENSLQPTV